MNTVNTVTTNENLGEFVRIKRKRMRRVIYMLRDIVFSQHIEIDDLKAKNVKLEEEIANLTAYAMGLEETITFDVGCT